MASAAQFTANRLNAINSTGPVTESGKAKSSRNALTIGLYTRRDYVKPDEGDLYKDFCQTMLLELGPAGLLQQTLAEEIVSASWRLRRCGLAEAFLGDFDEATDKPRRSIERARAAAHSILHRNLNQLRKLRTERSAPLPAKTPSQAIHSTQLASICKTVPSQASRSDRLASICKPPLSQPTTADQLASICTAAVVDPKLVLQNTAEKMASICKPAPSTPRNAPCPCRSGEKFKRCCGRVGAGWAA